MATRTSNGKKLLELIRKEVKQINRLKKRSATLVVVAEDHLTEIRKLLKKMSKEDRVLYAEHLSKILTPDILN